MIRRHYILFLVVLSVSLVTIAISLLFTDTSFSRPSGFAAWYYVPDSSKTVADTTKNAAGASTDTTKNKTAGGKDTTNVSNYLPQPVGDTIGPKLKYPIEDRQGDFLTNPNTNPFELNDPSSVVKKVEYDPTTDRYILTEQVDGHDIRPPTYMTFQEYLDYEAQESQNEYFRERANSMSLVEQQGLIPKLTPKKRSFGEIFGPGGVEIRPSGNVDITFGGNWQKVDNPILTEAARKQGGFNFDMHINMNVVGSIGDKLKINLAYNTGATFDFENQIKLKYEGKEDDIIKSIEAGNVSFPLKSTLIQGPTSLFGVKTKLQFGRLTITSVFSQQKSKSQSLTVQNGSQIQNFSITCDKYDVNRDFFLAQAFRDNYDHALSTLPNINSLYNITRIEVWVTNKTGATQNVRNVATLADLGENNPAEMGCGKSGSVCWYYPNIGHTYPDNGSNTMYATLTANPSARLVGNIVQFLTNKGSQQSQDFEVVYARELASTEFTFNAQLGYISLNTVLAPDDILGVAYQYTYNGTVYQVGDFAEDVPPDSTSAGGKVLYLKMLKASAVRPTLPLWNLMMKNIYSLGAFQVNAQNFNLQIYFQDPGGGLIRYIPAGSMNGKLLLQQLNLDNLNSQMEPYPDGIFDFLPGITIIPATGRIIFPVLEPFGSDLRKKFAPSEQQGLADEYIYTYLYDSTQTVAQEHPELNRYVIAGTYSSSTASDISLGAFNIPQGSVKVSAGGVQLVEGTDYTVDYSLGRVKILNQAILAAGTPINISFENNALFGFETKTLTGNRLDYNISDKLGFGFTELHEKERPFTQKVNIGDDPISNTIFGLDGHYNTESPFITWLLDKIPFYHTKEKSTFGVYAEGARLHPGHPKVIGSQGQVYIDDFEGASSNYDLRYPAISWHVASTPMGAQSATKTDLFPEANLVNDLRFSYNRALLCWYNIDPLFQYPSNSATPSYITTAMQSNDYVRSVQQTEVFPNETPTNTLNNTILTFDMAYYPYQRGMYNYESTATGSPGISAGLNNDGTLKNPASRWGGIMRALDNTDFEAANVEYIEFWVFDPFRYDSTTASGGSLYINLGDVSEDVERDGLLFFENALPVPGTNTPVQQSVWGNIPELIPIINAFDNVPSDRALQDIGLDGLTDAEEQIFFSSELASASSVVNPTALATFKADPSSDDYHYYLGSDYDAEQLTILQRYKKYNGTEGNSPVQTGSGLSTAATNIPDAEDINNDNSLNQGENYYQYRVDLKPGIMEVGQSNPFLTDKETVTVALPDGQSENVNWYQFKIPINSYDKVVGNISDFRSIRFMRMFLTGWSDSVVLRFAELALVRNQWRTYTESLVEPGEYVPTEHVSTTTFNVGAVSVEENSSRYPIPYLMPPGVYREQNLNAVQNVNALLNESSLDVQVCNLQEGDARGVYKDVSLDLREYKRLQMFVHGEANSQCTPLPLKSGDVEVFIRIGSDFTQNYYEYAWPLDTTAYNSIIAGNTNDTLLVWPTANDLDIPLDSFVTVKLNRDKVISVANYGLIPYSTKDAKGNTYTVVGEPDLGVVEAIMLGVRNKTNSPRSVDVWFDELRLNGLDEQGGWGATARVESQLADLGNATFAMNMHTQGFGQLEATVDQRYKDNLWAYNFATTLQLGKFFPLSWGLRLPMYIGYSQSFSTPEYDPYEQDVPLVDKLALLSGDSLRDYRRQVQTYQSITSVNFTNVRVVSQNKSKTKKPLLPWNISNFNVTFAYSNVYSTDPQTLFNILRKYRGNLTYNYAPKEKPIFPFKKLIRSSSKWFDIIRDINFNPMPSSITFTTTLNRQFGENQIRPLPDETVLIQPTFNKFFNWDRAFAFKYNPFKSLALDFSNMNTATIDEPQGLLDTKAKRDSMWDNFLQLGRDVHYQQTANASYNVPIDKIPLFDWIKIKAAVNTQYSWTAGPLILDSATQKIIENPLGNTIANAAVLRANADFSFKTIYDKFGWLKPYNSSTTKREDDKHEREKKIAANKKKRDTINKEIAKLRLDLAKAKRDLSLEKKSDDDDDTKDTKIAQLKKKIKDIRAKIRKLKQDRKKIVDIESPYASPFIRPIIMLKTVSATYTQNYTTTLPGWVPNSQLFGQSPGFLSPGPGFTFGLQPGQNELYEYANKGWITTDTNLNYQFIQTSTTSMSLKGTLEPFRDFRIDLTMVESQSSSFSEYFKMQYSTDDFFSQLNPQTMGSYSISYLSIKTAFQGVSVAGITQAYTNFETYRSEISQRLGAQNPHSVGNTFTLPPDSTGVPGATLNNFRNGYGPYSQDVLIPAFIAAYTGISPDKVRLDPFGTVPRPNWRITYNGLNKFKLLKKLIKNCVISHAYNSTLTLSGYQTNLNYTGEGYLRPSSKDSTNNFVPLYNVPQITITEQFAPLVGIDITWFNGMTTKFVVNKSRNLSMSFVGYALSESHTTEYTFGYGYLLKGLKFGKLKFHGKPVKLENNINFACDVSYRYNITISQLLDQDISQPTSGATTIIVSPYITYIVSKRLKVKIFFERNRTIPTTSASFPITNTKAGITLSFNLTP